MIIDDILDAGISIAHHEDAGVFELLFAQPAACHKCGHNTSKKGYTSVRPIVDCVDGQAMKIYIKHRRFYCHNCKSYVASDDEAKLATIIEPRAKYTNAVKSFILKELIHWVDLPYREWETTFGVSKSCVENWAKTVFKKLGMSIPWLLPCRSVYCMQFFYQGINRMATLGIGENGEQYICHIAEDDNDGSLHHYLELVNHKNETTKYVFVDGDVEDCEIIQASLRRVSWKKALSGDKYEINHPDNFKIINNILSNTHTSSHVILSPTSIEKIAYDNAKMANNKSQKYNDVILKKCAKLGATMIRECLGTDSTELHKKLSDKLRSLDIELLAEEIQGDAFQMSRNELARTVSYVAQKNELTHSTVFDCVLLGRKPYITWSVSQEDLDICTRIMERVGLLDFQMRYLDELSGGELQKVMLARALVAEPKLLLLDEPTSNLDPKNQYEMMALVHELAKEQGFTVITVIHDLNLALRFCDKFYFLKAGEGYSYGGIETVTAESLNDVYGIKARVLDIEGRKIVIME